MKVNKGKKGITMNNNPINNKDIVRIAVLLNVLVMSFIIAGLSVTHGLRWTAWALIQTKAVDGILVWLPLALTTALGMATLVVTMTMSWVAMRVWDTLRTITGGK